MLVYMPDSIYNHIQEDPKLKAKYDKLVNSIKDKILVNDLTKIQLNYTEKNLKKLTAFIDENTPKELLKIKDIVNGTSKEDFSSLTTEEKLYFLYYKNSGKFTLSQETIKDYRAFMDIFNEVENPNQLLLCANYAIETFLIFFEHPIVDIYVTIEDEQNLYANIYKKLDSQYTQFLYNKRMQMMTYLLNMLVKDTFFNDNHLNLLNGIIERIGIIMNNPQYKYNSTNYFKLIYNQLCFYHYINNMNFEKSLEVLNDSMRMIKYGLSHKEELVKSLNFMNKRYNNLYLNHLQYIDEVITYLPNYDKKIDDYISFLSNDEYSFVKSNYSEKLNYLKQEEIFVKDYSEKYLNKLNAFNDWLGTKGNED